MLVVVPVEECAATADIFGRGGCTPEPGSEAFDPIGCGLWRLGATTYTTLGGARSGAAIARRISSSSSGSARYPNGRGPLRDRERPGPRA